MLTPTASARWCKHATSTSSCVPTTPVRLTVTVTRRYYLLREHISYASLKQSTAAFPLFMALCAVCLTLALRKPHHQLLQVV